MERLRFFHDDRWYINQMKKGIFRDKNCEAESNPVMQGNDNLSTLKLSIDKGIDNNSNKRLEDLAGIMNKVDLVRKQIELDGLDIERERLVDIINAGGPVRFTKTKAQAKWKRVVKGNINKENSERDRKSVV